jgi:N-acetylmuramoyl-L-alanine amidase
MKKPTAYDMDIMTKTIWGEARGSTDADRIGVACVIKNRATKALEYFKANGKPHPLFGNGTIAGACLQRWQFSCWNENDPNKKKIEAMTLPGALGDSVYRSCMWAAIVAIDEFMQDITKGSTHYYAASMKQAPAWARDVKPAVVIGGHIYFNNVN